MSQYGTKPDRFLFQLHTDSNATVPHEIHCVGFEVGRWRCEPFAKHLVEWLPDYALIEDELDVDHGNAYVKLSQAAVRVYTSDTYKSRGEIGEIALHAICRDFFSTTPISPRVFFKSSSNDVVKSFDLVHARFPAKETFEIWLGEAKLYDDGADAIRAAVVSIRAHIEQGFLTNQKLLLGPQIPKTTPHYDRILKIFKSQTSIDDFLSAAVFVIGILCNATSARSATERTAKYRADAKSEIEALVAYLTKAGIDPKLKLLLIYVPLADKVRLTEEFDKRLKALQ